MAKAIKVNWNMNKAGKARYKDEDYKMFYTKVMRGEKGLKGKVIKMSPMDYLKAEGEGDYIIDSIEIDKMKIKEGRPISIPVLDKTHKKKVAIDIVLACQELGVKEIPVLVCVFSHLALGLKK